MGTFKRSLPKVQKFQGDYTFADFSYGLYNLDTPRSLPEQVSSLALTGGRNVWIEKGALNSQYGFDLKDQFDEGDIPSIVSSDNNQSNNIFIICTNMKVYYYTTLEGLKKYKTDLSNLTEPIIAHNGDNLYIVDGQNSYIFGSTYEEDDTVEPIIVNRRGVQTNNIISFDVTDEELEYFWLDKKLVFKNPNDEDWIETTVISDNKKSDNDLYPNTIEILCSDDQFVFSDYINVGERTLHELNQNPDQPEFVYIPEDPIDPDEHIDIKPVLMAVALNRLWVVDEENRIFYSSVGELSNFQQAFGAGYFSGFYQDESEVLSIEEFYSGVLITKQTGMYHITLTTKEYSYGDVAISTSGNYINISKVNNISQRYPGDHVIIGSEVIAFDSSSGNLIQAAYVNYLGNVQEGSILLHGSEIDSASLGILNSNRREMAYSFQEEILLLYYGIHLDKALVITRGLSLFPRETTKEFLSVNMFAQGFINITNGGEVIEDFKRGTIIPDLSPIAEFEPIALRGNKLLNGSIIEVSELNGVRYNISTLNAGNSEQSIVPLTNQINRNVALPNLIYSDLARKFLPASYAEQSKWAAQKSNVTRIYAPLSGRDGLRMSIEFEPNCSFCLLAVRFPDMSQGE